MAGKKKNLVNIFNKTAISIMPCVAAAVGMMAMMKYYNGEISIESFTQLLDLPPKDTVKYQFVAAGGLLGSVFATAVAFKDEIEDLILNIGRETNPAQHRPDRTTSPERPQYPKYSRKRSSGLSFGAVWAYIPSIDISDFGD